MKTLRELLNGKKNALSVQNATGEDHCPKKNFFVGDKSGSGSHGRKGESEKRKDSVVIVEKGARGYPARSHNF